MTSLISGAIMSICPPVLLGIIRRLTGISLTEPADLLPASQPSERVLDPRVTETLLTTLVTRMHYPHMTTNSCRLVISSH